MRFMQTGRPNIDSGYNPHFWMYSMYEEFIIFLEIAQNIYVRSKNTHFMIFDASTVNFHWNIINTFPVDSIDEWCAQHTVQNIACIKNNYHSAPFITCKLVSIYHKSIDVVTHRLFFAQVLLLAHWMANVCHIHLCLNASAFYLFTKMENIRPR